MLGLERKATVLSATAHALVLVLMVHFGRQQPTTRGYPRTLTATLVAKAPAPETGSGLRATPPEPPAQRPAVPQKKMEVPRKAAVPERKQPKQATPTTPAPPRTAEQTPPGDKAGGSPSGAGRANSGIARLDAPEFPFPHYLALLQMRIENQWRPPFIGKGQHLTTIHFVISRDGRLLSAQLENTSGSFDFDQAALRAVHNANPLPALPEGSGLQTLGVHFDFVANW